MANYEGNKIKRCWLSDFLKKVGPKQRQGAVSGKDRNTHMGASALGGLCSAPIGSHMR